MLTALDLQHLQELRLKRLGELLPQMKSLELSTSEQTLVIKGSTKKIFKDVNEILATSVIVLGCSRLEIHLGDARVYFGDLQSKASTKGVSSMTAETLAASRDTEFNVTTEPSGSEKLVSWQIISAKTGESEQDIKQRSTELNISFHWVGESWGMAARDASQLVVRHFFDRGQAIAAEIMGEESQDISVNGASTTVSSPAAAPTKPVKPKTSKPTPIKFQSDFTPVKEVPETVKRYLEAIAPGDIEAQNGVISEVTNETTLGKRHLDKLLSAYPDSMAKPTRFKLQSSFKNIGSRRKKEGKKSTAPQAELVEADATPASSS